MFSTALDARRAPSANPSVWGEWIVFSREARLAHHSAGEVVRGRDLPGGARLLLHGGELLSQHLHTPTLTASSKD